MCNKLPNGSKDEIPTMGFSQKREEMPTTFGKKTLRTEWKTNRQQTGQLFELRPYVAAVEAASEADSESS